MKKSCLTAFFTILFLSPLILCAQIKSIPDSLQKVIESEKTHDTIRVTIYNQLAFENYYRNPELALRYAYQARNLADSIQFSRGLAEAYRQVGLVFWALADIPTAVNSFYEGLRLAEAYHHDQVQADILGNIGMAYNGLGNPDEALKFLNQAVAKQRALSNLWREASVLNNIGDSYLALKNFSKAVESYTLAMNTAKQANYQLGISTNLRNIGNVHEANGQYDSALMYYNQSRKLSESIHDNRGFILSHKSIASVFLKKGQYRIAEENALIALKGAEKANLRAFMRDLYELLYKISEAEGKVNDSFQYLKLYSSYRDSVQNLQVASEVATQRLTFENQKKQNEINVLKKDAELQAQQLSARNYQLISSGIILLLAVLLLVLFIRNYSVQKNINILLVEKNKEIDMQSREISNKNDELIALNEEIVSQQEEVIAQRDALEIKNQEIAHANELIKVTNENLEKIVKERTSLLEKQNEQLTEYAFINAHKLRAPLASILGLINLMMTDLSPKDQQQILLHLKQSSDELDKIVHSISSILYEGISLTSTKKPDTD
jgi:tetratricopeptide (TPR) repeat protein